MKNEPKTPKKRKHEDALAMAGRTPVRERIQRFLVDIDKGRYDRTPNGWDAFEAEHAWLWEDPNTHTQAVLVLLTRWLQVELPSLSSEAEHIAEAACIRRVLVEPAFHGLFRLHPHLLHIRLAAVRTILEKDFRDKPELLLYAYEQRTSVEMSIRKYKLEEAGFSITALRRAPELLAMPPEQFETEFATLQKHKRHHRRLAS